MNCCRPPAPRLPQMIREPAVAAGRVSKKTLKRGDWRTSCREQPLQILDLCRFSNLYSMRSISSGESDACSPLRHTARSAVLKARSQGEPTKSSAHFRGTFKKRCRVY